MPNQSDPNPQTASNPPAVNQPMDLPPLPADLSNQPIGQSTNQPAPDQGSAAPPETPTIISNPPKKKFGGGRLIATILGVLVLVGGLGAGYVLTQQPQLFQQKAVNPPPRRNLSDTPEANAIAAYTQERRRGADDRTARIAANQAALQTVQADIQAGDQTIASQYNTSDANNVVNNSTGQSVADFAVQNAVVYAQPGASCSDSIPCTNGYSCSAGTCQPSTSTSCKQGDLNAPVCCTAGCDPSNVVCEPGAGGGGRKECNVGGIYCTISANSPDCQGANTTTTTQTTPPTAPACLNVTAYSSTWTALTSSDLSALSSGTTVNFCVAGSTGTFDQAQFKINSTTEPITTTKGQGAAAADFCQSYTILPTDTTVSVKAKIHDATSSTWVGESF